MPTCHLTGDFVRRLSHEHHEKRTLYFDADIKGFLLELRQSGSGTYYFRYRSGPGRSTLLRLGRLSEITLNEARFRAYQAWKSCQNGDEPVNPPLFQDTPSVRAFIEEQYLPYASSKKRSWKTESSIIRHHILPNFGDMRLDSVKKKDVLLWQKAMNEHLLKPGSVNRAFHLLKYIFSYAMQLELIRNNPCSGVSLLRDNETRIRCLSRSEALALLRVLDEEKNTLVAFVIRLLLFTGARKSELLAARWENIDMERRLLTVPSATSGRSRHIPLSDTAVDILRAIPRTSPWVFPSPTGDGCIKNIFRVWDRIRRKARLQDMHLHDLRHSFASFLVSKGSTLYEVQKILGHADPRMTMRYAHLTSSSLINAANRVSFAARQNDPQ